MPKRRVFRILGLTAGIAILLLGAAVLFLHSSTAKRLAFAQIQTALKKNGIVLEGADFDYSLLGLQIAKTLGAEVAVISSSDAKLARLREDALEELRFEDD